MRCVSVLLVAMLAGCRCADGLRPTDVGELRVSPAAIAFDPTTPGQPRTASLEVTNTSSAPRDVAVAAPPPFSVSSARLTLQGGETTPLTVTFTPDAPGEFEGLLTLDGLSVPLTGRATLPPSCTVGPCEEASWDLQTSRCVVSRRPDGVSCSGTCITQGQCAAGQCVGAERRCDDRDPCTVDACGEQGCTTTPRLCAAGPCQAASCQADAGCVTTDLADGTLCGDDDCVSNSLPVCIGGQCVRRVRPQGQCPHGWVVGTFPARGAMAYDEARARAVAFDGLTRTTWVWGGYSWVQKFPRASPPTGSYAMAWAPARQRIELFGMGYGAAPTTELWSWDGSEWSPRNVAGAPPARLGAGVAFDAARNRLVVFGGSRQAGALADTWEWDGVSWRELQPTTAPEAREHHAMAFDARRQRVVLFGGQTEQRRHADTWEWDGTTWTRAAASGPPAMSMSALGFDLVRQRLLLVDGFERDPSHQRWEYDGTSWRRLPPGVGPPTRAAAALITDPRRRTLLLVGGLSGPQWEPIADTWEWDGATWQRRALDPSPAGGPLAWDPVRERIVCLQTTGSRTWEWDGARWHDVSPTDRPSQRFEHQLAFDVQRGKVLLMGGGNGVSVFGDTWTWDGRNWMQLAPATSPAGRTRHAMAWDGTTGHVLLTGGLSNANNTITRFDETWAWSGATWVRAGSTAAPVLDRPVMAFDEARQRVVLVGAANDPSTGGLLGQTWEWDGGVWAQLGLARPPPASRHPLGPGHALAYDSSRRRVVLFAGPTDAGSETWTWEGTTWAPLPPSTVVPPMGWMSYDAARQRLVLVSEESTWVYVP
jgi:hypothetical protein